MIRETGERSEPAGATPRKRRSRSRRRTGPGEQGWVPDDGGQPSAGRGRSPRSNMPYSSVFMTAPADAFDTSSA